MIDKVWWVVTTGKGVLPAGHRVGYIEAENKEAAENNLIESGQITEKYRGFFNFEEK